MDVRLEMIIVMPHVHEVLRLEVITPGMEEIEPHPVLRASHLAGIAPIPGEESTVG